MFEAESSLKKGGVFGNLFGVSDERYQDAGEKFTRAGNAFKAAKAWASAARAYQKSAESFVKGKSDSDASSSYIECARCYIKAGDSRSGTEILETHALPRIIDSGRLSQAAKLHQEVGKMFEDEGQYDQAVHHYQSAADYFNAENSPSSAQKCLAQVGHLAAQLDPPDYGKASATFEQVGQDCLSSNLLKFSAKGYFFNAVICTLARGDVVAADMQLSKFREQDYTFEGCREHKLLTDVIQAFQDGNDEAFTDSIYNFDQISKLDPWRTTILLKIKMQIMKNSGKGNGSSAGGDIDLT